MGIVTVPQETWLTWRRGGIGSSDAPAILGVSPHNTRLGVFNEKMGRAAERPRKAHLDWGLMLEDDIAEAFTRYTGIAFEGEQVCMESESFPQLRATLDRMTTDGRVVELKAVGAFKASSMPSDGDWEGLPEHWIIQAHHQMIVAEVPQVIFAVFVPLELRVYTVPRSIRLTEVMLDLELEFWECVCDDCPPRTLDLRDVDNLTRAYPQCLGEIQLGEDFCPLVDRLNHKDDAAKVAILSAMGGAATALLPDGRRVARKDKVRKGHVTADKAYIELVVTQTGSPNRHAHV